MHRTSKDLKKRLEQDHRGVNQRSYPMRGLKTFEATAHFCSAFDELRQSFRSRCPMGEAISRAEQRRMVLQRFVALKALIQEASEQEMKSNQST